MKGIGKPHKKKDGEESVLCARIATILNAYLDFLEGRLKKRFFLFRDLKSGPERRCPREAVFRSFYNALPVGKKRYIHIPVYTILGTKYLFF